MERVYFFTTPKMTFKNSLVKILVLAIIIIHQQCNAHRFEVSEESITESKKVSLETNVKEFVTNSNNIDITHFKIHIQGNENNHNEKIIDIRKRSIDEVDEHEHNPTGSNNNGATIERTEETNTKTIEVNKNSVDKNQTKEMNVTEEEICVGQVEYCNMSKEEYIQMIQDYVYPQNYEWVLIATHTVVFVGGLVGNALVCVAVYRNHSMRTVTNYFIVNLAVADFMVILFCLPPTVLWDVTETWFFGTAMCKFILYFQSVSVSVSVLTLTFISVDRWYAVCFPLRFKSTTGRAKAAILVIWAISLSFNAPELIVLTTASQPLRFELQYLMQCIATWSLQSDLVWHVIKLVFIYTVPLLLMSVAYYQIVRVLWRSDKIPGQADTTKLAPAENSQLRSRRKAAKMLAAVVVMFAVCYFPVHLLSVLRYTVDMEQNEAVTVFALISHVLCYANSAVNPLIYNFMSGKFRREFRRAFCCSVAPPIETTSTMTRLTTCKKKTCELIALDSKRSSQAYNCQTTLF